jgi:hypothetical protein
MFTKKVLQEMKTAIVPNTIADIIASTTLPFLTATAPFELEVEPELELEPEPEPEPEPELLLPPVLAEELPLAVPVAEDPAEDEGATETRFLTGLHDALESEDELV